MMNIFDYIFELLANNFTNFVRLNKSKSIQNLNVYLFFEKSGIRAFIQFFIRSPAETGFQNPFQQGQNEQGSDEVDC